MNITSKKFRRIVRGEIGRLMEAYDVVMTPTAISGPDPSKAIPTSDFEYDYEKDMAVPKGGGGGGADPDVLHDTAMEHLQNDERARPAAKLLARSYVSFRSKAGWTQGEDESPYEDAWELAVSSHIGRDVLAHDEGELD